MLDLLETRRRCCGSRLGESTKPEELIRPLEQNRILDELLHKSELKLSLVLFVSEAGSLAHVSTTRDRLWYLPTPSIGNIESVAILMSIRRRVEKKTSSLRLKYWIVQRLLN